MGRFRLLFTELPVDEGRRLGARAGAEINEAKKALATEATALLHGRAAAEEATASAGRLFGQLSGHVSARSSFHGDLTAIPTLSAKLPATVIDLLATAKIVASKGEARRLVAQGGVRLNDAPVTDATAAVTAADLRDGGAMLTLGKKRHLLVRAG